jgi:hypothetical protein
MDNKLDKFVTSLKDKYGNISEGITIEIAKLGTEKAETPEEKATIFHNAFPIVKNLFKNFYSAVSTGTSEYKTPTESSKEVVVEKK